MRILLTNDDGIGAEGIAAIRKELLPLGAVTVVAPEHQRSALSHSITLYSPLVIREAHDRKNGLRSFAVNGTPVDSVKLALRELMPEPPDLVVSGINKGLNTGSNVFYSGTVAAALEASLFRIPAVALSLENRPRADFRHAARTAIRLIRQILRRHRAPGTVFNINFPARKPYKGVLVTRQEQVPFADAYDRRTDLIGRTYFWIKGNAEHTYRPSQTDGVGGLHSDAWAVSHGYVSITPLKRDLTDRRRLGSMRTRAQTIRL
ncbi:MAG: 5'/3'-nucleotidase SurE [Planctomycetes bacterium RBG_16_59_8]|nr:MAG: 5'/3'-nucleotidase SurE [Planctomycetes bacterium RBG_16_59_8]